MHTSALNDIHTPKPVADAGFFIFRRGGGICTKPPDSSMGFNYVKLGDFKMCLFFRPNGEGFPQFATANVYWCIKM